MSPPSRLLLLLLLHGGSAAAAAAAAPPPLALFRNVNAAFSLDMGPRGQGAGRSSDFVKFVAAGVASLEACAAAAAAWRNASAPPSAARCLSATWFRSPSNASFADQCYCLPGPKWFPAPSTGADSARLLWPCESAEDCSFNGECGADGACACDAAWGGPRCAELQLLPVDAARPGLRLVDAAGSNVSTWGAPMLRDEATGTWHAWPSELEDGCGINSWRTNSHVVHATAPAPGGPWTRREEVRAAFAHEPDVARGPKGELVMVFAGFPLPNSSEDRCLACADGTTLSQPLKGGCGPQRMHVMPTLISVARDFASSWSAPVEIARLSNGVDTNAAIVVLPNGSSVALMRGCEVWTAAAYNDNTTWRPAGRGLPDSSVEDPDVWVDRRGAFHALVHAMDVGSTNSPFPGGHAFSRDGLEWVYTGFAFGSNASYSDGSWQVFSRRERPHIVLAADGVTPIALSSGVQYAAPEAARCDINGTATTCDCVFSLVQPIATAG